MPWASTFVQRVASQSIAGVAPRSSEDPSALFRCLLMLLCYITHKRTRPLARFSRPAVRHPRGTLDVQRCLFNLHRRLLPIDVIRSKAQEYVDAGLADAQSAHAMVRTIELERGGESVFNERHGLETEGEGAGAAGEGDAIATKLNMRQLAELLTERPANRYCLLFSNHATANPTRQLDRGKSP